jgi:hypothetical protein
LKVRLSHVVTDYVGWKGKFSVGDMTSRDEGVDQPTYHKDRSEESRLAIPRPLGRGSKLRAKFYMEGLRVS